MMVRTGMLATVVAGVTVASVGLLAAPVSAVSGGAAVGSPVLRAMEVEREVSGACSAGARWDLNLEREFGVIDIGFEIDAAVPGERWTVTVKRNGSNVLKVTRPADAEGEVDVDRIVRDRPGSDRVSVRAVAADGQVCRASLRI